MKKIVLLITTIAIILGILYLSKQSSNNSNKTPSRLYKILSIKNWEASENKNTIALSEMDTEFIHLATKEQVERIVKKFWKGIPSYVLLTLDTKKLSGTLILEANPGGTTKYYHLYNGSIPREAIIENNIIKQ